jgi:hypothetical protein
MSCGRCGGTPEAVARLETQGNTFRMFRCAGCGDVTWQEFRQEFREEFRQEFR